MFKIAYIVLNLLMAEKTSKKRSLENEDELDIGALTTVQKVTI